MQLYDCIIFFGGEKMKDELFSKIQFGPLGLKNVRDNSMDWVHSTYAGNETWIKAIVNTPIGPIPVVRADLDFVDTLGSWKARWGINRMNFSITPGLYALGSPDSKSPVLVTGNYKMSFDRLRKELSLIDAWIMVLDTKGINVWCAAGKGTFGTKELVNKINTLKLSKLVNHNKVILPQLGAPGISAQDVLKQSNFQVVYGPIMAKDLKEFLKSGMKATPQMRTVRFNLLDRLVLTPMELVDSLKQSILVFGVLFLLNLLGIGPFGIRDFYALVVAVIIGTVITPVLLPWIPGRAFAWKGWLLGIIWALAVNYIGGWPHAPSYNFSRALSYLFLLPPVSAYLAMNFTGSSTYTSFSGVMKEMKYAVPGIFISLFIGTLLMILSSFM